jgi:hypothetical protein
MRADRVILQFSAELVSDLFVNRVNDFLAGKHRQTLLLIAPMQRLGCVRRAILPYQIGTFGKGWCKKIDAKHTACVAQQDLKREDDIGLVNARPPTVRRLLRTNNSRSKIFSLFGSPAMNRLARS